MENKELKEILQKQVEVKKEVKYNNFLKKNDGFQLNRVSNELGLSDEFMREYTYNSKDKNELIGYILSSVKGENIVQEVVKNATNTETPVIEEEEEENKPEEEEE